MTGARRGPAALSALWNGAALASLFFLPLVQALEANTAYLFWQPRDTAEFAIAFAVLALVLGAALYLVDRFIRDARGQVAALLLLSAIPLASASAAMARQFDAKVGWLRTTPRAAFVAVALAGALMGAWAIARAPARTLKALRAALLALSPVSLILLIVFARLIAAGPSATPAGFDHEEPRAAGGNGPGGRGSSLYIFLFDELSYRFVYREASVRPELPNLSRLSGLSTNYHAAAAPDDRTITSLPGLLANRDVLAVTVVENATLESLPEGGRVSLDLGAPGGLFAQAKANGLRTEMVGYYLPYCRLLAGVADACTSYSWYNYSGVVDGFSPLDPILTNIVLWPYQQPFGILKVPALSSLQRRIVERTAAAAVADLPGAWPRLRFVHFSVPHHPFVFDRQGYRPAAHPMDKTAANYEQQLRYVDTLVGGLMDRLQKAGTFESSAIVVMSDHEYRWPPLEKPASMHIPLIVKRPGQRAREDITAPTRAREVLEELVRASGARAGGR